jgi:hypothetical protein
VANRKRNIRMVFYVTEEEQDALIQKMAQAGTKNRDAYMRKMAIEGYIIRFDTTEAQELLRLIANATGNINQLAKRANESRSVHENDVKELAVQVEHLKENAREAINIYRKARKFLGC